MMEGFSVAQIIKMLLAAGSFGGLCAFVGKRFKLEAAIAPFVTACGMMVLLMLGGIAHILAPVWYVLFIGGFAGWVYVVLTRKSADKIDFLPVAMLIIALFYGIWRFNGEYYTGNDSFSHWGVVAKYLVRRDCFPHGSENIITFQSYPLGTTCFIYFFSRLTGWSEGISLCAFFLLNTIAFLPVLSAVKKHRALGALLTTIVFLFVYDHASPLNQLQVDGLLAIMGVGAVASIWRYGKNVKKALALAALYSGGMVFVKNSGIFFSIIIAAGGIYVAWTQRKQKSDVLKAGALLLAAIIAAYALWNIHVKLSFAHGMETSHAVSLSQYAEKAAMKSSEVILHIAKRMLKHLLLPDKMLYVALIVLAVLLFSGMYLQTRCVKKIEPKWTSIFRGMTLTCIAVAAIWYLMLFLVYVFSMPEVEAVRLASLTRYERTAHDFVMGMALLFVLAYFCREDFSGAQFKTSRQFKASCALLCAAAVCMCGIFVMDDSFIKLFRHGEIEDNVQYVEKFREDYDIEEGARYIVLYDAEKHNWPGRKTVWYAVKHEFFSDDILLLANGFKDENINPEDYYLVYDISAITSNYIQVENIQDALEEYADQYDYILVLDKDSNYESALKGFAEKYPDAKIAYAY